MKHHLQFAINKLQDTISPETGAGLVNIKVLRDGVVCGIQSDYIAIGIQQLENTGSEGVCLTITVAAVGKEEDGITIQLKCTIFQVSNRSSISIINRQRILVTQCEISSSG